MRTAIVLFTRDLRVHDNPALAAAAGEAERVLPLFVLDDALLHIFGAPNRVAFLHDSLRDLARSLGGLVIRRGDTVAETVRLAREASADGVFLAEDASAFARRRESRLSAHVKVRTFPSTSVVPLDGLRTTAGEAYKIFTPYWRVWRQAPRRALREPPRIRPLTGVNRGRFDVPAPRPSPGSPAGGETEGRERLRRFLDGGVARYQALSDDLAADATSRLSPYLHFGCVSPLELDLRVTCEGFRRQLCWRDFFLQLLAAYPNLPRDDFRRRPIPWRDDDAALAAWRCGQTGYPIVDAAMRQLAAEGWIHNRARLVVASFLTKTLRIHWRHGAAHFAALLVDGDLASNSGNWQWMAGTGTDPRPNRVINPIRQARRHDPDGDYVRAHVPELAAVPGRAVHTPWTVERTLDYPPPIVDPETVSTTLRRARRPRPAGSS